MIMVLARSSLNMIETLLSSALSDCDISHEEFTKIMDEKIKYEGIKESVVKVVQETEL